MMSFIQSGSDIRINWVSSGNKLGGRAGYMTA